VPGAAVAAATAAAADAADAADAAVAATAALNGAVNAATAGAATATAEGAAAAADSAAEAVGADAARDAEGVDALRGRRGPPARPTPRMSAGGTAGDATKAVGGASGDVVVAAGRGELGDAAAKEPGDGSNALECCVLVCPVPITGMPPAPSGGRAAAPAANMGVPGGLPSGACTAVVSVCPVANESGPSAVTFEDGATEPTVRV